METETFITTAAALTSLRDELVENDFDPDLICSIVADAAHALIADGGLGVRNA